MMRSVEISEETYRRLEVLAQARGISVEQALDELVRQGEVLPEAAAIEQLRASGFLVKKSAPSAERTPEDFQPVSLQPGGKPVSQILIEERR